MAVPQGSVKDVREVSKNDLNGSCCWRIIGDIASVGGEVERAFNTRRVYMDRRWREFVVPCHDHWHELQPGGQAKAIVVNFGEFETGFFREAGGSIASLSQQMSL